MAALQHSVGGLQTLDPSPSNHRSFVGALTNTITLSSTIPDHYFIPTAGLHKGFPAASFTLDQLNAISKPFNWSLIGKFSQGFNKQHPDRGRPSLEKLREYFVSLDLKGAFSIGLLDNRHLLIQLQSEEDYLRFYSRMVWYVGSITMRIFKWSSNFHVDRESSVVPIWIALPRLPIQFFDKRSLFPIASLIGCPLRLDAATSSLKIPSIARVQIELDLLKPRPCQIWIGMGEKDGFWQRVDYENVPSYCTHCMHVGHTEAQCRFQNPELQVPHKGVAAQPSHQDPKGRQEYVEKPRQPNSTSNCATLGEKCLVDVAATDPNSNHVCNVAQQNLQSQTGGTVEEPPAFSAPCKVSDVAEHSGQLPHVVSSKRPEGEATGPCTMDTTAMTTNILVTGAQNQEPFRVAAQALDISTTSPASVMRAPSEFGVGDGVVGKSTGVKVVVADVTFVVSSPIEVSADSNPADVSKKTATANNLDIPVAVAINTVLSSIDAVPTIQAASNPVASSAGLDLAMTVTDASNMKEPDHRDSAAVELVVMLPSIIPVPMGELSPATSSAEGGISKQVAKPLNVDAVSWYPGKSDGFQNGSNFTRELPSNFANVTKLPKYLSNDYDVNDSDEAEDTDRDSHEDFLDSQIIRDDTYLQHRKNRNARKIRDVVEFRGRGRPLGSRNRTYFDVERTMSTRSRTLD